MSDPNPQPKAKPEDSAKPQQSDTPDQPGVVSGKQLLAAMMEVKAIIDLNPVELLAVKMLEKMGSSDSSKDNTSDMQKLGQALSDAFQGSKDDEQKNPIAEAIQKFIDSLNQNQPLNKNDSALVDSFQSAQQEAQKEPVEIQGMDDFDPETQRITNRGSTVRITDQDIPNANSDKLFDKNGSDPSIKGPSPGDSKGMDALMKQMGQVVGSGYNVAMDKDYGNKIISSENGQEYFEKIGALADFQQDQTAENFAKLDPNIQQGVLEAKLNGYDKKSPEEQSQVRDDLKKLTSEMEDSARLDLYTQAMMNYQTNMQWMQPPPKTELASENKNLPGQDVLESAFKKDPADDKAFDYDIQKNEDGSFTFQATVTGKDGKDQDININVSGGKVSVDAKATQNLSQEQQDQVGKDMVKADLMKHFPEWDGTKDGFDSLNEDTKQNMQSRLENLDEKVSGPMKDGVLNGRDSLGEDLGMTLSKKTTIKEDKAEEKKEEQQEEKAESHSGPKGPGGPGGHGG